MNKRTKIIGVAGVAAGAVYLSQSENRQKLKQLLDKVLNKNASSSGVEKLGRPSGPADADMVDEGAMTSVQYFNELQQEYKDHKQTDA